MVKGVILNSQTVGNVNRTAQFTPSILCAGLLLCLAWAGQALGAVQGGASFIEKLGQQVITVLQTSGGKREASIARFESLFADSFDVPFIARAALGRHARNIKGSEAQAYEAAFSDYVVSLYAAKFAGYDGQNFVVTAERQVAAETSLVSAQLRGDTGAATDLGFVVHRSIDGELKVIDVTVEGVSLLVAKRSEFASVINRRGLPALTALLREKTTQLRAASS